jgi:hypothetical protein
MAFHSYIDSYSNIPLNVNNYSGINYQLAMNVARTISNATSSSPSSNSSSSNFGLSPSDKSDSIQATSSGSYMTHYYFGNGNYVRSCRG